MLAVKKNVFSAVKNVFSKKMSSAANLLVQDMTVHALAGLHRDFSL